MSKAAETTQAPAEEPNWFVQFLSKFRDAVRGKIDAADYDAALKTARSSVGGLAKAHKSKTTAELAACDLSLKAFADGHAGLFVGLFLDPASAGMLAIEGGVPAEQLHVTIAYIPAVDLDELAWARLVTAISDQCGYHAPLTGCVSGSIRFYASPSSDALDVFCAAPDVKGLAELRTRIAESLGWHGIDANSGEHGWSPHISLAYIEPGAPDPVDALPDVALSLDAVTVSYGERTVRIAMKGEQPIPLAYGEVTVGAGEDGVRLFTDVAFAEVPSVIPILPASGTYNHPTYGEFTVDDAMIDRIVANFDARVLPQDVPINAEHVPNTAGSLGYIRKLVKRPDGGLNGEPEFTDLGRQLIERDRFKYCSAEVGIYLDPLTLTTTPDVLRGVALTTRPFFKETYLPRMAASDDAANEQTPGDRQEDRIVSDNVKQFTEAEIDALKAQIAADVEKKFTDQLTAKDAEAKAFADRVASLEEAAQTKKFSDEVAGRAPDNDGGKPYVFSGEYSADYVAILRALPDDLRTKYQEIERRKAVSFAEQMKQLGTPQGTDARGSDGTPKAAAFEAKVRQYAEEHKVSRAVAYDQVALAEPQLFAEAREEGSR